MTDDASAYGIEDEQADTGRGDTGDPAAHEVAVGDDEPDELREEGAADEPGYEPLEPDEPA